jgi:hypothetical protein
MARKGFVSRGSLRRKKQGRPPYGGSIVVSVVVDIGHCTATAPSGIANSGYLCHLHKGSIAAAAVKGVMGTPRPRLQIKPGAVDHVEVQKPITVIVE